MCESIRLFRIVHSLTVLLALILSGCTSMYFQMLEEAPTVEPPHPSDWPWTEYWTGVIFNGEKIGFTHQKFVPDRQVYRISSKAALRLRFITIDKQFAAITHDWVDARLQLERFEYDYKIDQSRRKIKGEVKGRQLELEVSSQDQTDKKVLPFDGELVPMNAIYLYPVLHGLQSGKVYHYQVFDGESLAIVPVKQTIVAYQSSELFEEKAFKVETEVLGLSTTTWLDAGGLPQFELSLRGILISALEPEKYAKEYLTQAALAKSDYLLSYSMVPVDGEIENPRSLKSMHVGLNGIPEKFKLINTSMQQCHRQASTWQCRVQTDATRKEPLPGQQSSYTVQDTLPSFTVNSTAKAVVQLANELSAGTSDPNEQVYNILDWLEENIEKEIVDSYSALDVLKQREAECQGHSMLYAALARSLGIPTRLLNGLVYSKKYNAFLYHTWVESYIDNRWQPIDPVLGQRHADATHIVLIEGEALEDLTALLPLLGQLEIELY